MGFEKIVCCYHRLTAYIIQYLLLTISIIGFFFNIIGLASIKWEFIPNIVKFIYILCFITYIFSILCISILIYFRKKKTINGKNNKPSIKISIANIILSIIGIIFSFICLIVCWIKYDKKKKTYINGKKAISGWNKFFMFLCLGLNSRCMTFLFFFWISILIRLIKKTSGAYIEKEDQKSVSNNSTVSVERDVKVSYGISDYNLK